MAGRAVLGNLPAEVTSFVGRRQESGEVKRLLGESRSVTLTGSGGTGKTRLALRVAADARRAFGDGVWFVDLTELHAPGLLAQQVQDPDVLAYLVAATLGLRQQGGGTPLQWLVEQLADRQMLLILDNCEHLIPASAILAHTLLGGCPRLRVLVTSREPLAIAGETLFAVPPLSTPDPRRWLSPADMIRCEAVALFVARAQAAAPGFGLTEENHVAVAELCHRLDGLPLAIELAAARVRVLAPGQILDRLADRFALLSRGSRSAPERQQTLRACVDWSFDLCAKPERVLWERLSVFVGGFELDAVEGICTDEVLPAEDLLGLVAGLLDKSIIVRDDVGIRDDAGSGASDVARYRMLETIQEFGRDKLAAAGMRDALRRRHRDWYRQLATRASVEWISDRQAYWISRLSRAISNLRAAVEYGLAEPGQAEVALDIAVTVPGLYWWISGRFGEGRRWLDSALAQATAPIVQRARALLLDGQMAVIQNQAEVGMRLLDEGETLARHLHAIVEIALAAYTRGQYWLYRGDLSAAIEAFERTSTILATVPLPESGLALELRLGQLIALATASSMVGDHDRADRCHQELLAITEPRGEHRYRSSALWARALSTWRQGKTEETVALLEASLQLKQAPRSTDRYGAAGCLEVLAWVAVDRRQFRRAALLLGAAAGLWAEIGVPRTTLGHLIGPHEASERDARLGLGDAVFTDVFAQGQALLYDDAIAYALGDQRQPATPVPAEGSTPLTRRERQVADLIAQGLSNKEIAGTLVIAQRTAESHVEHILTKLGFTSRAQVAAWKATQQNDRNS